MYTLFELLFKKSYWRMLLRKASWQEAGMSLRRAHKDKRARKHLRQFLLMLLIPVLCLAYLSWVIGTGALLFIPFVIPLILWRARRAKQEAVPHIAPQPEPIDRKLSLDEQQRTRAYLADLTLFYATMVTRASSESFLKQKTLPEGVEITSRRSQLDLLRDYNLWDRMARTDREALMMPDGHWDWPYINHVSLAMEPLRLLRWILRIDFYLPTVGQQLRGDYAIAWELLKEPRKVTEGKDLVELATLRVARDTANNYLGRCFAEGISRGYYHARTDDIAKWADQVSTNLKGKQHDDLVLGGKLVSEVSEEELRWATSLAQRRFDFLRWVMAIIDGGTVPDWEMSVFPPPKQDPGLDKTTSQEAPANAPEAPAPSTVETEVQA